MQTAVWDGGFEFDGGDKKTTFNFTAGVEIEIYFPFGCCGSTCL